MDDASAPDFLACENCARYETHEANLVSVHRVYLELDEWGEEEPKATVVEEVERWCMSCRSIYPHEVVEAS
ncbi:MAG TPA: hypothetical protein VHC63_00580 [Acidimicrobiales bacterium]|nr:hypothetical protein [Acidimicrobiales bacterium]